MNRIHFSQVLEKQRVAQRRITAIFSEVDLLNEEQRARVFMLLCDRVEADANGGALAAGRAAPLGVAAHTHSKRFSAKPSVLGSKGERKTDLAQAAVVKQPGIRTVQVAEHTGQSRAAADSTLRDVERRRGTIEHRDGRWYPVTDGGSPVEDSFELPLSGHDTTPGL